MRSIHGCVTTILDAPVELVWCVICDPEVAVGGMAGVKPLQVLSRDADSRVSKARAAASLIVTDLEFDLAFSYDPGRQVTFERTAGHLDSLKGTFTIESLTPAQTRLTYEIEGDLGRVLGAVVRGPVDRLLRNYLIDQRPKEVAAAVHTALAATIHASEQETPGV